MKRYLPFSKSSSLGREDTESGLYSPDRIPVDDDKESTTSTIRPGYLPTPNFEVKRVDLFYSTWSTKWKYRDSSSSVITELRPLQSDGKEDVWGRYCFVVVREIPQTKVDDSSKSGGPKETNSTFKIVVKSPYLLKACKDVMGQIQGISWDANPLELKPLVVLKFLPYFQRYRDEINVKELGSEESYVRSTVDVLLDYLRNDYRATLASLDHLTSQGEITFDLLYALFVPRSIIMTTSAITGEPEALQLSSSTSSDTQFSLFAENVGIFDYGGTERLGRAQRQINLPYFDGTVKIDSLPAYPIQYHPHEDMDRNSLIARGRKWATLCDGKPHHMHYEGSAVFKSKPSTNSIVKWNINSRVMIDRPNFKKINSQYSFNNCTIWAPPPPPNDVRLPGTGLSHENKRRNKWDLEDLTDDELLIVSPILWGFSFSDKMWLEFDVEYLTPVVWNDLAFSNLVLPSDRKMLLQSLVESHATGLGFDDFVRGKGQGLVVNLFGPPGVGKTLSAEATSEHVKRPLFVVGAGDLGTNAADLDQRLHRVFDLATVWKAIVLIDEADVFLEERSLHDLERNAMVAVFLRHLEYYPAILFLTTNRVKTFDPALLSRIHIALHFQDLSTQARAQVWTAFLEKVGVRIGAVDGVSEEELKMLSERDINGRQVKNATKTAQYLAANRGETLRYKHLAEVLEIMQQFFTDFENMRRDDKIAGSATVGLF